MYLDLNTSYKLIMLTEKQFYAGLSKIRESRLNDITRLINIKTPKEKAGLQNEVEEMFYDRTWKDAEAHEKKYGDWPVFEMGEIDYDDPILDVYSSEV